MKLRSFIGTTLQPANAAFVVLQDFFKPLYVTAKLYAHGADLIHNLLQAFLQGHAHPCVFGAQSPERTDDGNDASNCKRFNHCQPVRYQQAMD